MASHAFKYEFILRLDLKIVFVNVFIVGLSAITKQRTAAPQTELGGGAV